MEFASDDDREDLEKVGEAFQRHCIGEVNVTYERYTFNRRVQDVGETFDTFVADLRRLAKSCEFGALEESIIRDRIVIGIRDDPTRRKLLQTRKLDLNTAIDIGKASEVVTKQLKVMSTPDEKSAWIQNSVTQRHQESEVGNVSSDKAVMMAAETRVKVVAAFIMIECTNRQRKPSRSTDKRVSFAPKRIISLKSVRHRNRIIECISSMIIPPMNIY